MASVCVLEKCLSLTLELQCEVCVFVYIRFMLTLLLWCQIIGHLSLPALAKLLMAPEPMCQLASDFCLTSWFLKNQIAIDTSMTMSLWVQILASSSCTVRRHTLHKYWLTYSQ